MKSFAMRAYPFAERGYRVFPLVPASKQPITHDGVRGATSDRAKIAAWAQEYPSDCNVGLACGPSSGPAGLIVMDVDAHHGGLGTMQHMLTNPDHVMPLTPTVRTPRGGFHAFFTYREITNRVDAQPGIDIRSNGGYVVAAGSHWDGLKRGKTELEGGGRYTWVRGDERMPPEAMPEWLFDLIKPPPPPPVSVSSTTETQDKRLAVLVDHVRANQFTALNATLFWALNRAIDNGLKNYNALEAAFLPVASRPAAPGKPGHSVAEARRTIRSACEQRGIAT